MPKITYLDELECGHADPSDCRRCRDCGDCTVHPLVDVIASLCERCSDRREAELAFSAYDEPLEHLLSEPDLRVIRP